jgi:hypothetical protein
MTYLSSADIKFVRHYAILKKNGLCINSEDKAKCVEIALKHRRHRETITSQEKQSNWVLKRIKQKESRKLNFSKLGRRLDPSAKQTRSSLSRVAYC